MKLKTLSLFVGLGLASTLANASPLAFNPSGNYTKNALFNGTVATKSQCDSIGNAVWVESSFGNECVVYFASNFKAKNKNAFVYLSGDYPTTENEFDPIILSQSHSKSQKASSFWSNRLAIPYIEIGRLGMGASSGNHGKYRRTKAEVEITNIALDMIKAKLNIQNFTLTGHSGGGHTVAGVVNKRSDVKCAVYGSSPLMPALMEIASSNKTANADFYEPIEDITQAKNNKALRSFIVGDVRDYGGWRWKPMITYAKLARQKGLKVDVISLKANDPLRHDVTAEIQYIGGWCASDAPTVQIIKQAYKVFSY